MSVIVLTWPDIGEGETQVALPVWLVARDVTARPVVRAVPVLATAVRAAGVRAAGVLAPAVPSGPQFGRPRARGADGGAAGRAVRCGGAAAGSAGLKLHVYSYFFE